MSVAISGSSFPSAPHIAEFIIGRAVRATRWLMRATRLMESPARAIGLHHLFASIQSGRNTYGARCSSRFAATLGA